MSAGAFVDVCKFNVTSSGTGDFVVSSAVTGYQTPASAGAVNATVYSYRAESANLAEWEIGFGAYTVAGTTLARTTIVASSTGSKVSFTAAPQVGITALTADLVNAALLTSGTLPAARITFAAKSDQTTGTSNTLPIAPLHQQDHDSAVKAWAKFTPAATPVVLAGYNVSSVTRTSAGIFVVNFTVAFASADYVVQVTPISATSSGVLASVSAQVAGAATIQTLTYPSGGNSDPSLAVGVSCYGRQ